MSDKTVLTQLQASELVPVARHPLRPGEIVTVWNLPFLDRPRIEGRAVVLAPILHSDDAYRVRFVNERRDTIRLVLPGDFQTNPERMLAGLTTVWRTIIARELCKFPFEDLPRGRS